MASISHHKEKGYRVHWRFTVRSGPRTGEIITGSLLLGRCTRAAAKTQLREVEAWEQAVKIGQHIPDAPWEDVRATWLRDRELMYTDQTLARTKRVLSLYARWRKKRGLPCKTVEQFASRGDLTAWRDLCFLKTSSWRSWACRVESWRIHARPTAENVCGTKASWRPSHPA